MSETFVADVRKFAEAAGCTTDEFNVRQTALYIGLQLEEMAEKLTAIFPFGSETAQQLDNLSGDFKSGRFNHLVLDANRQALLDADVDLAWVTIGSMLSQGADVTGAMNEVMRSNMSKMVEGRMVKDANGKVVKPDTYSPPNLAPFVKNV